ncbi:MAG: hypothetical protein AAFX76_05480 [Planctomycetota bacterium]
MSSVSTEPAFTAANAPEPTAATLTERCCDALPGWMCCVAGVALLGAVVLTPAWLELDEAAWRLGVMRAQARALSAQAENYAGFAAAIADDDPVVLERLAMTHLRMGAAGKTTLRVVSVDDEPGDVGAWLSVPQPVVGVDLPDYVTPANRLTRLVTGPARPWLLAVGLLCVVGGVGFNPRSR